ncbi:CENP-Q, a CENPA-CAD centromere complex subunit-domain-containing protein [Nemania sp. NC0429]|nr:CENP-Q, a CENPA-CAD centromere complex subunit-domain-containing protein [Nemania sp. NC0429]
MAPAPTANQKRKRGQHRANAPRDDNETNDASNSIPAPEAPKNQSDVVDDTGDGAMIEESRPRKRGRPSKADVAPKPPPEPSEPQSGRRSQRQLATIQTGDDPTRPTSGPAPSEKHTTLKKRGRPRRTVEKTQPSAPEADEADDENENEGNSSLLRRSRRNHRPSDDAPVIPENRAEQGSELVSSKTRRAGRPRTQPVRLADKHQPEEDAGPAVKVKSASRIQENKRPRPSQDSQPSTQKKRGRPRKPETSSMNPGTGVESGPSRRQKEIANKQREVEDRQSQPGGARRKLKTRRRVSEGPNQSPARSSSPGAHSDSDSSPPPYRHIAKRTRQVRHEIIESKWTSLDPSSVTNIANLFHSISLPTLLHVVPKQYAHAEDILEKVIRGLRKRSARLPFPPASTLPRREDELNFERTQSAVEVLLSQLDPLRHSVELLRREKERAEKELERQYTILNELSSNARAEAREWRDRLRKVHVLVPEATNAPITNNIDVLPADKTSGQVFADVKDKELLGLASQINNHMESMRGNLQQIDGVLPAIAESHALLRATLQPRFGQKQLDNIMLGQVEQ